MDIVPQREPARQVDILLDYLRENGSATGLDIIGLGILNYKGRISDLRKAGYYIVTRMETHTNKKGESKTYARYILKGE